MKPWKSDDLPGSAEASETSLFSEDVQALSDPRASLVAMAHRLQTLAADVDVQATVVNHSLAGSLTLHAMCGALAGLLWMVSPLTGTAVVFAIAWSAYVELEGGRGWLRGFLLKGVGHNLIVWGPKEPQRQLVLCAPLDGPHRSIWADTRWYAAVLVGLAVMAVGMAIHIVAPTVAGDVVGGGTIALLTTAIVGTVGILAYGIKAEPLGSRLLALAPRLLERSGANVSVTLVATQGGSLAHDGIDTFVRNHDHRLPSSRVIVITPSRDGVFAITDPEGVFHHAPADPFLAGILQELGAVAHKGVSGATRVHRAGYKAVGVGVRDHDLEWVMELVRRLDVASSES